MHFPNPHSDLFYAYPIFTVEYSSDYVIPQTNDTYTTRSGLRKRRTQNQGVKETPAMIGRQI
jgi:hypothetical protein